MQIPNYTKGIIKPREVADAFDLGAVGRAGGAAKAIAGAADTGANIALKFVQAEEATAVNEAVIASKKQKMEFIENARQQSAAFPEDFAERLEVDLKRMDDDTMAALPSTAAKKAYQQTINQVNMGIYKDNFNWAKKRKVEIFAESIEKSAMDLESMAYRYGQQGRSIDDLLNDADASAMAGSTFLTPEEVSKMQRNLRRNVIEANIGAVIERNPYEAKKMLDSQKYDKDLDGKFLRGQYIYIDNKIKAARAEAERAATMQRILEGLDLADPANKDHRKAINAGYVESGLFDRVGQGDIDAVNQLVAGISRTSIIPEAAQSQLRGWMMNGTDEQKATAYTIINQINEKKPDALLGAGGFSKAEVADAVAYNGLIRAGAEPQYAMRIVDDAKAPQSKEIREHRKSELNQIKRDSGGVGALLEQARLAQEPIGNWWDATKRLVGIGTPTQNYMNSQQSATAQMNFERLFEQEFLRTGSKESAMAVAGDAVSRQFGVTNITGKPMLMQHPPEKYFSLAMLSEEENKFWIQRDLRKAVKSIDESIDFESVTLSPTGNTQALLDSGQKPFYHIWYEQDGIMDMALGEDNLPVAVQPDMRSGLEVLAKREAAKTISRENIRQNPATLPFEMLQDISGWRDYFERKRVQEQVWKQEVEIEDYSEESLSQAIQSIEARFGVKR